MSQGTPAAGSHEDERPDRPQGARAPIPPQVGSPITDVAHLRPALALLLQGYRYAGASTRNVWDYAVEIQDLKELGLTNNDLRWMVWREWVAHASEIPSPIEETRAFERENHFHLTKSSCFVLTDAGVTIADQLGTGNLESIDYTAPAGSWNLREAEPERKPRWDAERQRLFVGTVLVKQYKLPCPNQGTILTAFEEEGWPPRIDNPLPPSADIDAKVRLGATIKSLNKNLKHRILRFMGDGSGQGVLWEFVGARQRPNSSSSSG